MSNFYENQLVCNGLLVSQKGGSAIVNGERVDYYLPRCYEQPKLNQDGNFFVLKHSELDLTQADLGLYFSAGFAIVLSVWLATKGIIMVVNFVKNL